MEDTEILRLFAVRSERAIAAANEKYGASCLRLAERMLGSPQDAEECLNDALLAAWNAIPPEKPESLGEKYRGVKPAAGTARFYHTFAKKKAPADFSYCTAREKGATNLLDKKKYCIISHD